MGLLDKIKGSSSNTGASSPPPPPPPPATAPLTVNTAEVNVRVGFIRKVYTLLTLNFLITIGISCVITFVEPVRKYVMNEDNFWVLLATFAAMIVSLLVLLCCKLPFPFNLIMMYVFVFFQSIFVGVIVSRYYVTGQGIVVLQAFILTAVSFLAITAYCAITKADFSFLYGFLAAGTLVLIFAIVFNFALAWVGSGVSRVVSFFISIAGYENFCFLIALAVLSFSRYFATPC